MRRRARSVLAGVAAGTVLLGTAHLIASAVGRGGQVAPLAIQDEIGATSPAGPSTPISEYEADTPSATSPSPPEPTGTPTNRFGPESVSTGGGLEPRDPAPTPTAVLELRLAGVDDYHGQASVILEAGKTTFPGALEMRTENPSLSGCQLTHRTVLWDASGTDQTVNLQPLGTQQVQLTVGEHTFAASCSSPQGIVSATYSIRITDRQPKLCRDFAFEGGPPTTATLNGLENGIVGRWEGCVTTPWVPQYFVSMEFRGDGTYSAVSNEVIDGMEMNAMYYGTEADKPTKKYYLQGFYEGEGYGTIAIDFDGTVTNDDLRDVRLMGDELSFKMYHFGHGPLVFELHRR